MVQPFVGLRKRDFVLCDAPEHWRVGTSDSAGVWEVFRQSLVEQIQYPLFFLVEFLLFSQNASLSNEVASTKTGQLTARNVRELAVQGQTIISAY